MSARGMLLLALLALGGCAERWIYTKEGVTPAGLDHDLTACRKQAQRPYTFGITSSRRVDREELNRCMERKGYTARPDA